MLQASKTPSKDLSPREVAAAERFSEHLLYLQRAQRAFLSGLSGTHARLLVLANLLGTFADAGSTPDQVLCFRLLFPLINLQILPAAGKIQTKHAIIRLGKQIAVLQLLQVVRMCSHSNCSSA